MLKNIFAGKKRQNSVFWAKFLTKLVLDDEHFWRQNPLKPNNVLFKATSVFNQSFFQMIFDVLVSR